MPIDLNQATGRPIRLWGTPYGCSTLEDVLRETLNAIESRLYIPETKIFPKSGSPASRSAVIELTCALQKWQLGIDAAHLLCGNRIFNKEGPIPTIELITILETLLEAVSATTSYADSICKDDVEDILTACNEQATTKMTCPLLTSTNEMVNQYVDPKGSISSMIFEHEDGSIGLMLLDPDMQGDDMVADHLVEESVMADAKAQYPHGFFVEIENKGVIDISLLSSFDTMIHTGDIDPISIMRILGSVSV